MNPTLVSAILALILAFQRLKPDDTERLHLLDEERQRIKEQFPPSGDELNNLDSVLENARNQAHESATFGDDPDFGENPLRLASGPRDVRRRNREKIILGGRPPAPVKEGSSVETTEQTGKTPTAEEMAADLEAGMTHDELVTLAEEEEVEVKSSATKNVIALAIATKRLSGGSSPEGDAGKQKQD